MSKFALRVYDVIWEDSQDNIAKSLGLTTISMVRLPFFRYELIFPTSLI